MNASVPSRELTIARAIEAVEREAWLDLFQAAPEDYVHASGLTSRRLGNAAALSDRSVPIVEFNRVFSLGLEEPLSAAELDHAIGWLRSNAAPNWAIQISPAARPNEVTTWLNEHGLVSVGTGWAKFHQAASNAKSAPPPSTLEIRSINKEFAEDFGSVVQAGFGLPASTAPWFSALVGRPGWSTYLAFDGLRPVAAAAMYIKDDWAWMGIDATLANARERGGQSCLIAQRLKDGLSNGVVGFTAETGYPPAGDQAASKSFRNYGKAGFALAYIRQNYKADQTA
jgi:hypothetical protein